MTQMMEHEHSAPPMLMTVDDLADALAVGTRTVWRWVSMGTFPAPDLSIGGKLRRWRRSTVEAWIDEQTTK
ncbi:MAG TPA: helix-turn-helix domain-containing protein [Tepidisphaeraceae bacterium]|jgi:excisionase family DNA binding protein